MIGSLFIWRRFNVSKIGYLLTLWYSTQEYIFPSSNWVCVVDMFIHYQLHPLQRRWCTGGSCRWVQERSRSGPSPYRCRCTSTALFWSPPEDSSSAWKRIKSTISNVKYAVIFLSWALCELWYLTDTFCPLLVQFNLSCFPKVLFNSLREHAWSCDCVSQWWDSIPILRLVEQKYPYYSVI